MGRPPWRVTMAEFRRAAQARGAVSRAGLAHVVIGPRGMVDYTVDSLGTDSIIRPDVDDDGCLSESMLRSLCRRLGVPVEDFGLADDEDDEDDE